jgi:hypothetical protein
MYGSTDNPTRKKLLEQVCWDTHYDGEALNDLLIGRIQKVGMLSRLRLLQRLLESYSWYTLLKLVTASELSDLLKSEVIDGLRSKSLQRIYRHAQTQLQSAL